MSLQTLLESANPYHSVQSDAARLAEKWEKTGLLEGLKGASKSNMGMILENQAKQLVVESSQTGGGTSSTGTFTAGVGEQWAGVALPLVRKVFGQIAAQEFVSVQPMNLPSGLVFYLDFQYGTNVNPFSSGDSMYGAEGGNTPFGNTNTGGLYGAGRFGYSINNTSSTVGSITPTTASWSDLNFDSDYSASATADEYRVVSILKSALPSLDEEGIRAFQLSGSADDVQLSQFTTATSTAVNFVISASNEAAAGAGSYVVTYQLQPTDKNRGDFEDGNTALNADNSTISIPEINVQMKSSAIVAKTRKLKAVWTPEFAQDLNAYHLE
jgi:hypothetical protein